MGKLPKKLHAHGPFTYQDAIDEGLNQYDLKKLLQQGVIERVSRGLYIPEDYDSTDPEAQYYLASLRCGKPSCICLVSALEFYHVTDEIANKVWIMVPQEKRVQASGLKLVRARNPQWTIGIKKTSDYWITTLTRTLIDCLLNKSRLGSNIAIGSLKTALNDKKVKLSEIIEMATKLGVQHRVFPYIETLAQ